MGAGKTQFVRWFLEASRIEGAASPTFAVHHRYDAPAGPVDHLDLYRVGSDDELESSGFWDLVEADRRDALLFVEWADRLPEGIWPPEWHRVRLNLSVPASGGESRVVEIETIPPSSSR
jgi:tRNA threonylcarbamoyladenosine biosynthesis protein TsaE